MGAETEDKLLEGCIAWDRKAQNTLYNLYASKMFAVCFKYSSSKEEAEDTFHEGFMKVFENIKNFRKDGSLEGWIRKIMVNTAIEKFRKKFVMVRVVLLIILFRNVAKMFQTSTGSNLYSIFCIAIRETTTPLPLMSYIRLQTIS